MACLDEGGSGTVTFTDIHGHTVSVGVTGNGTFSANLSSLDDGSITSALAFTDTEGNSAAATGNAVALDTDKTEVATLSVNDTVDHVINNAESTAVSFTVAGLDDGGSGTVTFTDIHGHTVSVGVTGNGTFSANLSSLDDGSITSALAFTDTEGNSAAATGNAVPLSPDTTVFATLSVNDTVDHVINNAESTAVSFTVAGLDQAGSGTVTFTDIHGHTVSVGVTGNGTFSANLSSLDDGSITSALAFTDTDGNPASATGNAVALDTDKTEVATLSVNDTVDHVINNAESTAVSFTVAGLDDGGSGTVTFTDIHGHTVSVGVTGNGTFSANLSSLDDGSITSALAFTDTEGNSAAATGNAVALDTDKTEVATLSVNDTVDHVIKNGGASGSAITVAALDDGGSGTVTFTDIHGHTVSVGVTGNGTFSAKLSSLDDGSSTSALAFTDTEGNSAAATGNAVALDTHKTEVATLSVNDTVDHVINNAESTAVSFTVAGLDDGGSGTVTFTDIHGHTVSVGVTGNGTFSANLSSLDDGSITSALAFTDTEGNRSEEHTSELQSPVHLVCRLLLEKK